MTQNSSCDNLIEYNLPDFNTKIDNNIQKIESKIKEHETSADKNMTAYIICSSLHLVFSVLLYVILGFFKEITNDYFKGFTFGVS